MEILIPVAAALVVALATLYQHFKARRKLSERVILRMAQAEAGIKADPEKTKPAWDLARATLEEYFDRNLGQISSIFWLSVVVMLAGFGIIVWGVSRSVQSSVSFGPAAFAGVAGIVTEFIGATFLFLYRSTIQQAVNYSNMLERINSVGMAMQILDTMPHETRQEDLKNTTKATIVELLVRQIQNRSEDFPLFKD
jgi:hypothetical protein